MKRLRTIVLLLCWAVNAWSVSPSYTLPIVYINTANGAAVTSKEYYIDAKLYIDPLRDYYSPLGSAEQPIAAHIKGRGNYTWSGFDKKPYKIKFDVKQSVLGMPNNRHWCLLAGADDYLGFLKNPAGHMLSEAIGLRWTPHIVPVELVMNGQYKGLYFLTEQVRIASNRVHIKEQANHETDSQMLTGGWLVEIDNYRSENNIEFDEGNGQHVMVSLKEPDTLSSAQRLYLEQQLYALNNALYGSSESQLEALLDINEAAKYYLVQELMEDCESYHGSCFLYKDRDSLGMADKWKFGPVWDFGNAFERYKYNYQEAFIYVNPSFAQYWIGQLATWPAFQKKVKEHWYVFYHDHKENVRTRVNEFANTIASAAKNDAELWRNSQGYQDNSDMTEKRKKFFRRYDWRIDWLYSQWGEGIRPATYGVEIATEGGESSVESRKFLIDGQVFILRNGQTYDLLGRRIGR